MHKLFTFSLSLFIMVLIGCAQSQTNKKPTPELTETTAQRSDVQQTNVKKTNTNNNSSSSTSQSKDITTTDKSGSLQLTPGHWMIKAKLGIRTSENNGSVTLTWHQRGDNYTIQLLSPLGHSKALINGSSKEITIQQPGKAQLYSTDPIQLIQDTFGWSIPLHDFKYWIMGTQNPNTPAISSSLNKQGHLEKLEQSDWVLNYSRYKDIQGYVLPAKIRAYQHSTRLTMLIREWQLL
jgi:outer membrane lipoprotein LolB